MIIAVTTAMVIAYLMNNMIKNVENSGLENQGLGIMNCQYSTRTDRNK